MREIKFRAWHGGNWCFKLMPHMLYDEKPGDCLVWINQGQNITAIMQYTGLKDKNEQEIYEGDVLRITSESFPENDAVVMVEWRNEGKCLIIEYPFGDHDIMAIGYAMNYFEDENSTVEVIGNIHETPSLLEQNA